LSGFIAGLIVAFAIAYVGLVMSTSIDLVTLFGFPKLFRKDLKRKTLYWYAASPIVGYVVYRVVRKLDNMICEKLKKSEFARAVLLTFLKFSAIAITVINVVSPPKT
jgi:membrane-associated protease RseP (regulator of RpoE activity)